MPAFDRAEAQRLVPFFKTKCGRLVMEAAFCIVGLDRFNRIYDRCAERAGGPDFARELLAFKRACEKLGCTREDVVAMMYGNAKKLIDGARRSIYGE